MSHDNHEDLHQWVSFEDPHEERTWVLDVTFLTSNWMCIFGNGCKGVLTEDATDLQQGCCSYGAHFVDEADRVRVEEHAQLLGDDEWQFASIARKRGGATKLNRSGERVTRMVDDACIFLNRPGFAKGPGCALHQAANARGESYLPWKPEVCWQLPLRREDDTDAHGHVTSTVREWKRRDWGEGGKEFHWWCTSDPEAFIAADPVYVRLEEELVELTSQETYDQLVAYIMEIEVAAREHRRVAFLPHPASRRPPNGA